VRTATAAHRGIRCALCLVPVAISFSNNVFLFFDPFFFGDHLVISLQSQQNLNSNYEWLRLAFAQNVAFFPWDLRHQNKPELACIYRNSKNRDLDL